MDTSQFDNNKIVSLLLENAIVVSNEGATCDTFMTKMHGKRVLIKRLKEKHIYNPRYISALKKEFETGFALDHQALPRYLTISEDAIIMDYIDGITLTQFVKEKPTLFNKKSNITRFLNQLLDCLSYLHSHSIVHLDLKPDNIMMTRIGNDVKVIDLGFCYTDVFCNTIGHNNAFAAPEQLTQECDVDIRADIYSVGKILEYILNGNPLRTKYNTVIKNATKKDKTLRFQTAEEFIKALDFQKKKYKLHFALTCVTIIIATIFIYSQYKNSNIIYINSNALDSTTSEVKTAKSIVTQTDTTYNTYNQIETNNTPSTTSKNQSINNQKHNDMTDFENYIKRVAPQAYLPLYNLFKDTVNNKNIIYSSEKYGLAIVECENNINKLVYEFLKDKPKDYQRDAYNNLTHYQTQHGYIPTVKRLQDEGFLKDHPPL